MVIFAGQYAGQYDKCVHGQKRAWILNSTSDWAAPQNLPKTHAIIVAGHHKAS